jgi:hypothetical protein
VPGAELCVACSPQSPVHGMDDHSKGMALLGPLLTTAPRSIAALHLVNATFAGSHIHELVPYAAGLTALSTLSIAGTSSGACFSYTQFDPINDQTAELPGLLAALPALHELQLKCCAVYHEPWQRMRDALVGVSTLTALRFDLCVFEVAANPAPLLHSMPALQELYLSRVSLRMAPGCDIHPVMGSDGVAAAFVSCLATALPGLPGLASLRLPQLVANAHLAGNATEHTEVLATLPRCAAITCLDLRSASTRADSAAAKAVAATLSQMPRLRDLAVTVSSSTAARLVKSLHIVSANAALTWPQRAVACCGCGGSGARSALTASSEPPVPGVAVV